MPISRIIATIINKASLTGNLCGMVDSGFACITLLLMIPIHRKLAMKSRYLFLLVIMVLSATAIAGTKLTAERLAKRNIWHLPELTTKHGNKTYVTQSVTTLSAGHNVLRQRASAIKFPLTPEQRYFVSDMKLYFNSIETPVGLAAPQLGKSWRIIIVQIIEKFEKYRNDVFTLLPPTIMINPSYTSIKSKGEKQGWEGCFSVPDKMGEVSRYFAIKYQYQDEQGKRIIGTAKGLLARVLQHEIDHLNGVLYFDHVTKADRFGSYKELIKVRMRELEQSRKGS